MSSRKWRWIFWTVVVVLVLRWWLGRDTDSDVSRPNALLTNRIWMEHPPKSPRDRVHGLVLLDKRRLGAASYSSAFLIHAEVLRWSVQGDELRLDFLQEKKRARSRYKVWRCKDAPKPFELCLELRDGRKVTMLYALDQKSRGDELPGAADVLSTAEELDESSDGGDSFSERLWP